MAYVMLVAGIAILLVCGDALVRGAVALSVHLGIPTLVIGLTVVAFGTSAPELVVSLRAALTGVPGIAIGNVVGSNIANIFLVLGLPAIIAATDCNQPFLRRNMLYVIGASLLFIGLCYKGVLTFFDGALLFSLLVIFLLEQARRAEKHRDVAAILGEDAIEMIDHESGHPTSIWLIVAILAIGLAGLPLGAGLTVAGASQIARDFGISDTAIGLTIVALGTSLPELAATLPAAIRGHAGLALGNVLGSNLFNLLAIMGVTAMVTPVPIPDEFFRMDFWVMLAASMALIPFVVRRSSISRAPGVAFVLCYVLYIVYVFEPGALSAGLALEASSIGPHF